MTLTPEQYRAAIATESDRFAAVLADAPAGARVPSSPDWDADDLLWHLTEVQHFWAGVIIGRPTAPTDDAPPLERPTDRAALVAAFDRWSLALRGALADADPGEVAWSWSREQTVGFTLRRQAQEALVHRVDAELAAGVAVSDLDPALADDGVAEALDVMYGGTPPEGVDFVSRGGAVAVRLTDTGTTWWTQPGELSGVRPDGRAITGPHLLLLDAPAAEAAAEISGTASEVDLWLWKRLPDDVVARAGDPASLAAFEAAVRPPIE